MRTLGDMLEQLKQLDEVTLLELLGLSSEDLIERFADIVETKAEQLNYELNQWFEDDEEDKET